MAYFGWPAAHDNDAERAARAGLAILNAIATLNEQPGHAKLSARVGIDSGTVVIGEGAGNEAELQPFASWKCEFSPFTNDSVPFRRRFAQQGSSFASRQKRRRFVTPTGGVVFPSSFFYWTDFVSDINANTKDNSFALLTEDGKSNKYLGDGVMAFFGYPEAHDNDAERAVRAGLATLGVSIV